MKSQIRHAYSIQYAIIILIIFGLTASMLFDLNDKMPLWLMISMCIILIGFPIFTIYSYLKIPKIIVNNDKVISKTIANRIEIPIDEIASINSNVFKNRIYSIGHYHVVKSFENIEIEIPQKIYRNEATLIADIARKHKSIRKFDPVDLGIKENIKIEQSTRS